MCSSPEQRMLKIDPCQIYRVQSAPASFDAKLAVSQCMVIHRSTTPARHFHFQCWRSPLDLLAPASTYLPSPSYQSASLVIYVPTTLQNQTPTGHHQPSSSPIIESRPLVFLHSIASASSRTWLSSYLGRERERGKPLHATCLQPQVLPACCAGSSNRCRPTRTYQAYRAASSATTVFSSGRLCL